MRFGDIVITTESQREHPRFGLRGIPEIKIGTRCVVIEEVDMPGYDLLVAPEGYVMKVCDLESGVEQDFHTVYLYRGSWVEEEKTKK